MSTRLSSRGLAALSVLLSGSSVASAQVGSPAPHTVVVANPLSPTPTVDPVANPTGTTALTPSIGLNPADRLLLPAVQKYNALVIGDSLNLTPDDITISPYRSSKDAAKMTIKFRPEYTKIVRRDTVINDKLGGNQKYTDSLVVAPNPGTAGPVQVIPINDSSSLRSFFPYGQSFTGGVNVATGDVNGDGVADIVTTPGPIYGAGPGGGPNVKIFDGVTLQPLASFPNSPTPSTGGIHVAAGDVNGDGFADIITAAGAGGGPHVKVFDGATFASLLATGAAPAVLLDYDLPSDYDFSEAFISVGDLDGDGNDDIVTSPAGNQKRAGKVKYSNIIMRRFSPASNGLPATLEPLGSLNLPPDLFGADYTGSFVAIPAEIDPTHPGQELVITAFSSLVSIPEPSALALLLPTLLITTRRRR